MYIYIYMHKYDYVYIYIYVTVTLYNITGVLVRIVSNWGKIYIHQGHILQILTVHPGFCLPQMGKCVIRLSRFFLLSQRQMLGCMVSDIG